MTDAEREQQDAAEFEAQVQQLETLVRGHLSREALVRYGSIKSAHPERALQILVVLGKLVNTGKVGTITDEQFKQLLLTMTPQKRESRISWR